jgi:hypothetical protein
MNLPRGSTRDDGYRLNGYTSSGKEHWIHPDTFAAINKKHQVLRWKNKLQVIDAYGGGCAHCGEKDPVVLNIDHIKDDGSKDLTPSGNRLNGNVLYGWIIKHGFPKDRYQVLCANCNQRKEWHRRGAYFERTESCN